MAEKETLLRSNCIVLLPFVLRLLKNTRVSLRAGNSKRMSTAIFCGHESDTTTAILTKRGSISTLRQWQMRKVIFM